MITPIQKYKYQKNMKLNKPIRTILPLAAFAGLAVTVNAAVVITPTGVTTTGTAIDGNRTMAKTIDGSGMSGVGDILTQTHAIASGSDYYLSNTGASNITDVQYDFDLNGVGNVGSFNVGTVYLWNYAASNGTEGRGIGETDIFFSTDNGATYSSTPVNVIFAAAANNTPIAAQTISFAAVSGVTDIRFVSDNISGAASNRSAIMEIRFGEAVPEPSTTALLGLGGLALILRRRR
ncbi:MAG: hypothetical protein ACJAR1_001052 [Rubritalea sp.]|jgi:hypothetical protein